MAAAYALFTSSLYTFARASFPLFKEVEVEVVCVVVLNLEGWDSIHAWQVHLVGKPEEWYRKRY